jgi:hypothetical protein
LRGGRRGEGKRQAERDRQRATDSRGDTTDTEHWILSMHR